MRGLAIVVVVLAVAVAACGDTGTSSVTDGSGDATGRASDTTPDGSWILISGAPSIEGFPISLTLDGQAFSGRAACNQYGGTIDQSDSGWRFSEMYMTEMGCEPAVMAAEQAFLAALSEVATWSISDGTLTLEGPVEPLVFTPAPQVQTAELIDTPWVLETILEGDTATAPGGDPATLLLNADGTITGSTGCRDLTGTWIAADAQIFFPDFAADGTCPDELFTQDGIVVTVLGDGFRPTIDGDVLTVTSIGDQALVYRTG